MISVIESQPAGSAKDLVQEVADIFSSKGILSRSKNFEFRPQQQEMAVAVHLVQQSPQVAATAAQAWLFCQYPLHIILEHILALKHLDFLK